MYEVKPSEALNKYYQKAWEVQTGLPLKEAETASGPAPPAQGTAEPQGHPHLSCGSCSAHLAFSTTLLPHLFQIHIHTEFSVGENQLSGQDTSTWHMAPYSAENITFFFFGLFIFFLAGGGFLRQDSSM